MVSGMNHQQMLYRDQVNEGTFNLLDSHDTARILTLCQGNKRIDEVCDGLYVSSKRVSLYLLRDRNRDDW